MESVAINVGANSSTPGGRGPIYADSSFRFVPITETDGTVTEPTYSNLGLSDNRPEAARNTVAHFDPEFPEIDYGQNYTYGDRHAPKTTHIAQLEAGDVLFFYATLDYVGAKDPQYDWINESWGAYIIGHFTLERDPVSKDAIAAVPDELAERLATNAHFRRDGFDAEYLVIGAPETSRLYDTALPLSADTGSEANRIVTELSEDSGAGPWYRRPLRFDEEGTMTLLDIQESGDYKSYQ